MRNPFPRSSPASLWKRLAPPVGVLVACGGGPTAPAIPELALETVATDLGFPLYVTAAPGDDERLFVVEKGGWIKIVRNGVVQHHPAFLDLQATLATGGEQGLLGLLFHPDYASNGLFFVHYTDLDGTIRIARFRVSSDPDRADPASKTILLSVPHPTELHNGGMLALGPDGHLYVALGDGGEERDPNRRAQNRSTLLGSILRLTLSPDGQLGIPADNPYVGEAGARRELWSKGLRNPWRFSFDRATGDLYIGDVGEKEREEIDIATSATAFGRGANYGWPIMEGSGCLGAPACDETGLSMPVLEYEHADGCAVTGGYVYRGSAIPALQGTYFYADFCAGWVRSFRLEDGRAVDAREWPALAPGGRITSFGEDNAGELYIVTAEGQVAKIVAR